MRVRVECYSGYKADERPLRFWLDEHPYEVVDILDRWYGPDHAYFKVRAADGNVYILRRAAECESEWSLESFLAP